MSTATKTKIDHLGPTTDKVQEGLIADSPELAREMERRALAAAIRKEIIVGRTIKGMTQEELGAAIGMKPANVARMERGKIIPSPETLNLVCSALEIQLTFPLVPSRAKPTPPVSLDGRRPLKNPRAGHGTGLGREPLSPGKQASRARAIWAS